MREVLFNIFGEPVYSYPLLMGLGWGVGFNIAKSDWLKDSKSLSLFYKLFIGCFISAWLGAKLFFLLFSVPGASVRYMAESNFWLGGGFVFYGGLVFSIVFFMASTLFYKNLKLKDIALFIPALFISHAIGRVGCFLAGCCFGSQCPLEFIDRHPVQLYESFCLIVLFFITKYFLYNKENKIGAILVYLFGYSICRFTLEFYRADLIRGLYWGLSTSQWVSLLLFFCGLTILLRTLWLRRA